MKIFISFTSSDRDWAHWIGWNLRELGHEAFVHDWEIGAGENIPGWMEARLQQADRLLGVFSDAYCKAIYSQSERWAAYWQDPAGQKGFLVPIEVRNVTKWPVFIEPLKRLCLVDLDEPEALKQLQAFLETPKVPSEKPVFPGLLHVPLPTSIAFTEGGEPLGSEPPNFPASPFFPENQSELSLTRSIAFADLNETIRCIEDHEPRPLIFGREAEIETIVASLLPY